MSLVHDLKLDAATLRGLKRLIATLPDKAVESYAHSTPAYRSGGFRRNQPHSIRQRIEQQVNAIEEIDDTLRRLLAAHTLNPTVVAPLATTFLSDHRQALSALFGVVPMRLARLLDARPEVRKQEAGLPPPEVAAEFPTDYSDESMKAATLNSVKVATLCDALATLARAVSREGNTGEATPQAQYDQEKVTLEERLRQANSELRRLKGTEQRLERLERQWRDQGTALNESQARIACSQQECSEWRRRALAAEQALTQRAEQVERQVGRLVEARLAGEFAGWFADERAAIAAKAAALEVAKELDDDPLLQRIHQALAAQTAADKVSGTRTTVRERLTLLEGLLDNVKDALANALRPQAQLQTIASELEGECHHLRSLLQLVAAERPVTTLQAAINTAPQNHLPAWRTTIAHLQQAGVIDESEGETLLATRQRRIAALTQERGVVPELRPETLANAADALHAILLGQCAGLLLLDGHNLLFALQSRYRRLKETDYPDWRARQWLIDDLTALAADRPTCRVRLVFDGPERSESAPAENVTVIYSGGSGEHRADRVLIEELRYFRQTPLECIILVSNDGDLCGEALRLGAKTLPATALLPFL